ncbi:MAG: hypothetical protein MUF15_19550 [Acidobacteria bacterium]|jgi:hypothetical protein|nr:hypothetical protein [Acidobacteriota bacterium]
MLIKKKAISIPIKIGILLSPLKSAKLESALKYLVLAQNTVQKSIEFIFLPVQTESDFLDYLASKKPISYYRVKKDAGIFLNNYWNWVASETLGYNLAPEERIPVIFISNAAFDNEYYADGLDDWGIIALGNWKRYMSPPSILEFFMTLIVERSVKFICGKNWARDHLTTKGCLFDFTSDLEDARYLILTGFICNRCRKILSELFSEEFIHDIELLISKKWIGSREEHTSIATNTKKLGYDLFLTKGIKPTIFERLAILLEEEGVKTILQILASIAIAGLLVWIGLKGS